MILLLVIAVVLLSLLTLLLIFQEKKEYSWIMYYTRGKGFGFTLGELNELKVAIVGRKIEDPCAVFQSVAKLDDCIRIVVRRHKGDGSDKEPATVAFMEKLYAFRKRIEATGPKSPEGIRSTSGIAEGQPVRVLVQGMGVYESVVLENSSRFLVLSFPSGRRIPKGYKWAGQKISIYFWRDADAGYVFDSYVMEQVEMRSVYVLHVSHSDSLFRTQKRRSVRAKSRIPAFLYILKRMDGAYEKPEKDLGMKCVIQDLSEDGFAVFIGGKAKPGLQVKVQFMIGDRQVVMSGVTKAVEFNSERNQSLLHVQALAPSARTRSVILSFVYNVIGSQDPERGGKPPTAREA
jgi:c-di-GMP-binding flagellar brake protein YcgR